MKFLFSGVGFLHHNFLLLFVYNYYEVSLLFLETLATVSNFAHSEEQAFLKNQKSVTHKHTPA